MLISIKEWFISFWNNFPDMLFYKKTWLAILDIALVYFLVYRGLLLFQGTKAVRTFFGLLLFLIVYSGTKLMGLQTISWIFDQFVNSFVLVLLILFQDEIRFTFNRLGINLYRRNQLTSEAKEGIHRLVKAVTTLSTRKVGALLVIERNAHIHDFIQDGTRMHADISEELLFSIFLPYSPIHDGAVLIRDNKIESAGCVLPLTQNPSVPKSLGTRHRAGIGISEKTDAVVIVVSETDGKISLCMDGQITRGLDTATLTNELLDLLGPSGSQVTRQKPTTDPQQRRNTGPRRRTGVYTTFVEPTPDKKPSDKPPSSSSEE